MSAYFDYLVSFTFKKYILYMIQRSGEFFTNVDTKITISIIRNCWANKIFNDKIRMLDHCE